jgi:hypothetical protein
MTARVSLSDDELRVVILALWSYTDSLSGDPDEMDDDHVLMVDVEKKLRAKLRELRRQG